MSESVDKPQRRKWYLQTRTWILATLLAGVTTFATGLVVQLLNAGVESLRSPIEVAGNRYKDCPYSYIIPGTPAGVPSPPDPQLDPRQTDDWVRRLGGADGDETTLEITVTGGSDKPTILYGLEIEVVERATPIEGFQTGIPCGGPIAARIITVDLDGTPPSITESVDLRNYDGASPEIPEEPITFPYTVSNTESEVFLIHATTEACNCSWRLHLRWASGEKAGTKVIDDEGRPFRTHFAKGYEVASFYDPPLADP